MQVVLSREVPECLRKVTEQLRGSRLVMYDVERCLWLSWHGGRGVHVYNIEGVEVSYGTVGDSSKTEASRTAVRNWMQDRIKDGAYPV